MNGFKFVRVKTGVVYCWVCSFLVTLAMNCKMECVAGGRETSILNGIYKLWNSFYSYNFTDAFVLAAVFCCIRYVKRQNIACGMWMRFFSLMLSVSYIVSLSYSKFDSAAFLLENSYQKFLSAVCIIGYYIIIYYGLSLIIICVEKNRKSPAPQDFKDHFFHRHMWFVAFFLIFMCWLPWIVMNYPGTGEPDSVSQLKQYLGDVAFNAHHPPLSTFIMGTLFVAGKAVWNANFGFFLYIFLQTLLGALIFSWSIKEIHELGVCCKHCFMAILYYALLPMWGGTMQGNGKDLLFAEFAALFVTSLMKIIIKRQCEKKEGIRLALAGILTALLRNNGIYMVFPTVLVLAGYLGKAERRKMSAVLCVLLFVYGGVTHILYPGMGIEKGSIKEALSIPFLQTARYVDLYGDEVTEYEKEIIESVLEYDALAVYNPKHADSVKNTYRGDDSKLPEYFKVWFGMFLKHPGCYMSAFLNKGGGYMAPVSVGFPAPMGYESDAYMTKLGVEHIFGNRFVGFLTEIEYAGMELPVLRYFCMAGTYTWIVLVCISLLLRDKIYGGLILFVPEVMNILVCIASPTWHIRYALPVMAVVPLMLGWTYCLMFNRMPSDAGNLCESVLLSLTRKYDPSGDKI